MADPTGRRSAPSWYQLPNGKEALDVIRSELGDPEFLAWCKGQVIKYRLRAGRKPGTDDAAKERFYAQMIAHLEAPEENPDPRSYRGT